MGMDSNKLIFLAIILVILFLEFHGPDPVSTQDITRTIQGKNAVSVGYRSPVSLYLVSTGDETFEVRDSIFLGIWDHRPLYQNLQVGHTYSLTVTGWRIPVFSPYRDIVSFREITR